MRTGARYDVRPLQRHCLHSTTRKFPLNQDAKTARPLLRALAACIAAFMVQRAVQHVWALESDLAEFAFCIALMIAAAAAFTALSARIAFGTFCAALLMDVLWLASSLKLRYLHEPLMAPDLHYLSATFLFEVVGHYPGLLRKGLIALVGGSTLAVMLWRMESPGLWREQGRWRKALVTLLACLPLLLCLWPRGPFSGIYAMPVWDFISAGPRNPISTFVRSFSKFDIVMPARATQIDAAQWHSNAASPVVPARRPDIIAILEESTLDPRQWADCTDPRCTVSMFQPDATTQASGLLRVHTYGGATWTSEFAFFSGLPHTLFGAAGIYAPFNLAPRMRSTLPLQLKSLGYHTVAMYPMPANFGNAATAYKAYGFDEFHDSNELKLVWESTDSDLLTQVAALRDRLRAQDDRPLFIMVLTMRQHGPHDYPIADLPAPWNQPPLPTMDARTNRNLGTYLYRLHQSDVALSQLRKHLFETPHPTLLVHFGDHHPSFDGLEQHLRSALTSESHAQALSDTYYRIDSNFAGTPPALPHVLDLAFLGSLVLDVAGLPKGAYFQANARLRERCNGLFEGCPPAVLQSYLGYVFDHLHAFE